MKREIFLFVILLLFELCSMVSLAQQPPITDQALQRIAASLQMFVDPLPQVPTLLGYTPGCDGEPHGPGRLTVGMYQTTWKFHRDFPPTNVFAYGTSQAKATVPGPAIEAVRGIPTHVTWENHLPENHILPWDPTISTAIPKSGGVPTVVHLHGGIHPPSSDGHAFAWFTANFAEKGPTWTQPTYVYPNLQSGNLLYHDHAVGLTRVNLLAGLIGPYIIRDLELEERLNLPSGPEFDRNLLIFDRSFYSDGSVYINRTGNVPQVHPQWQPEYFGHAIIVNGKAWPFLNVYRRKYRFRITNASNARYLNLRLPNGLLFTVIGSDNSYLPSPVTSSSMLLSPAETYDVVIDFSQFHGNEAILTNDAPYPYPTGDPVDKLNSQIIKFIIQKGPPPSPDTSRIPRFLQNQQSAAVAVRRAIVKRYIGFYEYTNSENEPLHLYVNGKRFSDPVTESPKTGSTEVWEVINLTGDNHPLHIHLADFQAIQSRNLNDPNGAFTACMRVKTDAIACNISSYATGSVTPTPAHERTWKNVVKIAPGTMTTVVVKFNLGENDQHYPFDATEEPGFVYHCHILDHEDNEMIRPLKLVR